ALVMGEDADDFIDGAVDADVLAESVAIGEKRFSDGGTEYNDGAGVLLVEGTDEAAAIDVEQRECSGVFRVGAADDYFFDGLVAAGDAVGVAEKETTGANRGDVFHVGSRGANKFGVLVTDVAANADFFRHARGIGTRRKTGEEVGARAEG